MSLSASRIVSFALSLMVLASGCVTRPPTRPLPVRKALPVPKPNYWKGDGVPGAPRIVIDLGEQRAFFYKGKRLVGDTIVSTGRSGYSTPTGNYRVIQKDKDHSSSLYGDFVDAGGNVVKANVASHKDRAPAGSVFRGAKMPYFLRFYSGYGLHAGRVPGHRASHGCVRLPHDMAAHFFNSAQWGTPVILRP